MKKILLLFIPITIFLAVVFINLQSSAENNQTGPNPKELDQGQKKDGKVELPADNDVTDEENNSDTTNSNNQEQQENEHQLEKEESQAPKYYVTDKYFIKPVDPEGNKKLILLTFDDAPVGKVTTDILDTLDKHNAKAIFFVNGHYVDKNKDLLKEIYNRGHMIGNHTWWHEDMRDLDFEKTKEEIVKVNDQVEEIIGQRPVYFRPPFGVLTEDGKQILRDEKMQSMNWSLGSLDWEYTKPEQKDKVITQVMNTLNHGSVILMHDKMVTSLALDQILNNLEEKGYTFVLPTEVQYIE